jgi:transposase-like protein
MRKKRRKWTQAQKLEILHEAEQEGVAKTLRKHGIYSSTYYQWKEKLDMQGMEGLAQEYTRTDPEKKELWQENQRLRQIVADQALALKVKEELLKKTMLRKKNENL